MTTLSTDSVNQLSAAAGASSRRTVALICCLLFLSTFALFSPAINHGFVDYDDPGYVTHNLHIQHGFTWPTVRWAFTTGYAANWHPLTWLSHTLDWKLFGDDARGHHADAIFWHSLSAMMAFLLFRRLTGSMWTSAFAAALFAWHPLRVESVAWVSERKDVLSIFFGLLTLWAYAGYAQARQAGRKFSFYYLIAFFSLAIGLLCKPTLVTIPCLMLVLDYWPLRRNGSSIAFLILEKIPFFLLAAISSIVTYHVQKAGGAVVATIPITYRLANASVSVIRYLYKFLWPFNLAVCYPYPKAWPPILVAGCVAIILGITGIAIWQRHRRPWILVGWLWYLGTLVPVVGIVQVGLQSIADRYTYLPLLGIELALLWTLRQIRSPSFQLKLAVAGLVLIACVLRTLNQLSDWRTPRDLYAHALAVTSDNYMAECYLGSVDFGENRFQPARDHFERSIAYKPDYTAAQYRLGLVLDKLGDHQAALAQFHKTLQLDPDDPRALYSLGTDLLDRKQPAAALVDLNRALNDKDDFTNSDNYIAIGMAYVQLQQPQEAINAFEHAIELNPGNTQAHYDYGNLLKSLNRDDDALAQYQEVIRIDPNFEEAYYSAGDLLRKTSHLFDAAIMYTHAIELNNQEAGAFYGLGSVTQDLGHNDAAASYYQQAIRIRPDFGDAQYNLGVLLFNANHPDAALPHLEAAVRAEPNNDGDLVGLGVCYEQLGNHAAAIECLRKAIAINPHNSDAAYFLSQQATTQK
jgi:tetratricopeptide (TPR) repeat protein